MSPRRIDFSLFDDNVKMLIEASAKIFPVEYAYVDAGTNPGNFDYVRITSGEHRNEVYIWRDVAWELIGADDKEVPWSEVIDKPVAYPPVAHNHLEAEITDLDKYTQAQIDAFLLTKAALEHAHSEVEITDLDKYTQAQVDLLLAGKANTEHNHALLHEHTNFGILDLITQTSLDDIDVAYTHVTDSTAHISNEERILWGTVSDKADTTALTTGLAGKSDITHTHDGRYYTESEVNGFLSGKANNFSNRAVLDKITESVAQGSYDLSLLPDLDTRLQLIEGGYSEGHTHANLSVLTKLAYSGALPTIDLVSIEQKAAITHNHAEADITNLDKYTQAQVDALLTGKANTAHTHVEANITNLDKYTQAEVDGLLAGKANTVHGHNDLYYTESEVTAFLAGKAAVTHDHTEANITDLDKYTQAEVDGLLAGKSAITHDHDGRYYTESEVNGLLSAKQNSLGTGTTSQYLRGDLSWQTIPTPVDEITIGAIQPTTPLWFKVI